VRPSAPILASLLCLAVGGCAQPVAGKPWPAGEGPRATAETPVEVLGPGIEVLAEIPDELPASGTPRIDHDDVCASIPPAALAELGYGEPHDRWFVFCQWLDTREGHHFVNVGYDERPLRAVVEETNQSLLSHLRWLRIDGHFAVETILDYDPMQSCSVWGDYGASESLLVTTYTGRETPTRDAVGQLCAKSRQVASVVLRHLGGS
jgi:hypothetical protein